MSKTSSFISEVVARLQGDTDKAIAAKNERLATAAINGQLAAKTGQVVELEVAVETAEEAVNTATYPTSQIGDAQEYVNGIIRAKNNLVDAEEDLEAVKAEIEMLTATLASFK